MNTELIKEIMAVIITNPNGKIGIRKCWLNEVGDVEMATKYETPDFPTKKKDLNYGVGEIFWALYLEEGDAGKWLCDVKNWHAAWDLRNHLDLTVNSLRNVMRNAPDIFSMEDVLHERLIDRCIARLTELCPEAVFERYYFHSIEIAGRYDESKESVSVTSILDAKKKLRAELLETDERLPQVITLGEKVGEAVTVLYRELLEEDEDVDLPGIMPLQNKKESK